VVQVAVAVALVLPATGMGSILHFAQVEHTACPEHGHLTHVVEHALADAPVARVGLTANEASQHNHDHHHCLATSSHRDQAVAIPNARLQATAGTRTRMAAPELQEHRALTKLALAPKGSPPA
jgi:hypothetical protein